MAEALRHKKIKLESVPESSSDTSDTESVHSFQGRETEYARDTSDTPDHNSEIEVSGTTDFQNILLSSSDESEPKDIAQLGAVVGTLSYEDAELDIGIQADRSEEISTSPTSNSDVDPELPRSDYFDFPQCLICKTEQKDINYPYCSQCFLSKKSFFPPRPKRKKKNKQQNQCNKETVSENAPVVEKQKTCFNVGCKLSSPKSDCKEGPSNSSEDKLVCKTCFARKMNGVFVHGSTGHMYSCFNCAKKTLKNIGVCPLCRRKCGNVIKVYTAVDE